MSDTPRAADDAAKLLDAGYNLLLFKNNLGSYTAVAFKDGEGPMQAMENERRVSFAGALPTD